MFIVPPHKQPEKTVHLKSSVLITLLVVSFFATSCGIMMDKNSSYYTIATYKKGKLKKAVFVTGRYGKSKYFYRYNNQGERISITRRHPVKDSVVSPWRVLISHEFYDNGNKKSSKHEYDNGNETYTYFTKYSHDKKVLEQKHYGLDGNIKHVQIEYFTYDSTGLRKHAQRIDSNKTFDLFYTYNDKGHILTVKSISSDSATNSYSTNGIRVDTFKYQYDLFGRIQRKYMVKNNVDSLIEKRRYR